MAITKFPQAPYYDDFDETKNYMRILFRPGYSVQARELNQLQTALQSQIDRLGSSIYRKEGARVLPVDNNITISRIEYIKIKSSTLDLDENTIDETTYLQTDDDGNYLIVGKTIRGTARGVDTEDYGNVRAEIIDVLPATYDDTGSIDEPLTLYVRYLSGGGAKNAIDDGAVYTFSPDETLISDDDDEIVFSVESTYVDDEGQTVYPTGYGLRTYVSESIYFVKGNFVHTPAQSVIIGRYSPVPSVRIVYDVEESIVTPAIDSTLNDNSIGTPNASAPGAHRYAITLTLAYDKYNPRYSIYPNAITIGSVRGGVLEIIEQEQLAQTGLGQILATRTYEESGNYYLNPFPISVQELYRQAWGATVAQGYLDGYLGDAQIQDAFSDRFEVGESPMTFGKRHVVVSVGESGSTAYVHGWRLRFADRVPLLIEKARTTASRNNISVNAAIGNYIVVDSSTMTGILPSIEADQINLLDSLDTIVGTARVRNIEYDSASALRFYLLDVVIYEDIDGLPVVSSFSDIVKIAGSGSFFADVTQALVEANKNSYVLPLPTSVTKEISDVQYHYRRALSTIAVATTTITWSLTGDDYFVTTSPSDYVVWNVNVGIVDVSSVTLNGTSQTATITVDYSAGISGSTYVIGTVRNAAGVARTKTRRSGWRHIISPNVTAGLHDTLSHYDVIKVTAIYASPNADTVANSSHPNVINNYVFDNGQRDSYYDYGRIRLKCDCDAPPGQLLVEYEYYEHSGSGHFFAPNSYSSDEYEVAGEYRGVKLRDAIDFRVTWDEMDVGSMISLAPRPSIILDAEYYLPRWDKISLSKSGKLVHTAGTPSVKPQAPRDLDESITLFTLKVGAYTFVDERDIRVISHDHRRYTMRDISKLDRRIANLEEIHELTSLENEVIAEQFLDDDLNPRYRNGFVTDNCKGHIVGYTKSIDYACSVDRREGIIYPQFDQTNCRLVLNTVAVDTTGYRKTGSFITLDYYQTAMIDQMSSSGTIALNMNNIVEHTGAMTLSPATDEWREVSTKPMIAIDDNRYDAYAPIKDALNDDPNLAGYIWNEWDTDWAGIARSEGDDINLETITQNINNALASAPDAVLETYGTIEVLRNVIPYMRSRKIYFRATGLKPNTRHWLFFGGMNISSFARSESTFVRYEDQTLTADDELSNYKSYTAHPDGSTKLISNDVGEITGSFIVPNTDGARFLCGIQPIMLVDTEEGFTNMSMASTSYEARGHRIENATRVLLTSTSSSLVGELPVITEPPIPDSSTTDPITPDEDSNEAARRDAIEKSEVAQAVVRGNWIDLKQRFIAIDNARKSSPDLTIAGLNLGPFNVHYTPVDISVDATLERMTYELEK